MEPYGGVLVDRMVNEAGERRRLLEKCKGSSLRLTPRQLCDVELLTNGGFSPLEGFMGRAEYESVLHKMRLPPTATHPAGLVFGIPVVLDVDADFARGHSRHSHVALMDTNGTTPVAVLEVGEFYEPDKVAECAAAYGTDSLDHPACRYVLHERRQKYVGGRLHGLARPARAMICETPLEVRARLPSGAFVAAFQCRNPLHRAHVELVYRALSALPHGGVCLIHPTVGPTQEDDIDGETRWRTYEVLKNELGDSRLVWAFLPYSMHMAGPREAIQHMIVRRNYGCTHFVVGRDMAGCKSASTGADFYEPFAAQELAALHAAELGVGTLPSPDLVYSPGAGYVAAAEAKQKALKVEKLSGTEFRRRLRSGEDVPEWFAYKSVVQVLRDSVNKAASPTLA